MEPENPRPLEVPLDDSLVLLDDLELRFLVTDNTKGTFATSRFQEQVLEDIREYRRTSLPAPHRRGSFFWSILPYCFITSIKS